MIWQKRSLGKVIILLHIWTFIILICVYFVNHRNIYSWISEIICSKIEHLYKLIDVYLHLCLIYHLCRLTALQYPYWLNQNAGEPIPVDPVSPVFAASCWFAAQFFCKLGSLWACCSACTLCVSVSYCIILFLFSYFDEHKYSFRPMSHLWFCWLTLSHDNVTACDCAVAHCNFVA